MLRIPNTLAGPARLISKDLFFSNEALFFVVNEVQVGITLYSVDANV